MGFKKSHGIHLTEAEQGLIRYTCLTYSKQPPEVKQKIDALIVEVGGEYAAALREVLTTYKGIRLIANDYYVHERTLYRRRKDFYEKW